LKKQKQKNPEFAEIIKEGEAVQKRMSEAISVGSVVGSNLEKWYEKNPKGDLKRFLRNPSYFDQLEGKLKYTGSENYESLVWPNDERFKESFNLEGTFEASPHGDSLGDRYKDTIRQAFQIQGWQEETDEIKKIKGSKKVYQPDLAQLASWIYPEAVKEISAKKLEDQKEALEAAGKDSEEGKEIQARIKETEQALNFGDIGLDKIQNAKANIEQAEEEKKASAIEEERARLYSALLGQDLREAETDRLGEGGRKKSFLELEQQVKEVMARYVEPGGLLDKLKKQKENRLKSLSANPTTTRQENASRVQQELDLINSRISLYSNDNPEGIAHLFGVDDSKRYSLVNGRPVHPKILDTNPAEVEKYKRFRSQLDIAQNAVGEEEGMSILKKYENDISKNRDRLIAYAGIQPHIGNPGGAQSGMWIERFKSSGAEGRKKLMSDIDIYEDPKKEGENVDEVDREVNFFDNFRAITDPLTRFYLDELETSEGPAQAEIQKMMASDAAKEAGLPNFSTEKIGETLRKAQLDFLTPGGQVPKPISAIDSEYIGSLIRNIANIQTQAINKKLGVDPEKLLGEILSGQSFEGLEDNLHYLYYKIYTGKEEQVKKKIDNILASTDKVANYDDWQTFYKKESPSVIGGLTSNTDYGIPPKWVDAIKNSEEILFEPNATAFDAGQRIIQGITHGTNQGIEDLFSHTYPFPELHPDKDQWGKENFGNWLYEYLKGIKNLYAPFGYTKKWKTDAPMAEVGELSAFKTAVAPILNAGKKENARGFIPNFSKIAGEIAASKTAGYKTPVTPSQVKSINIPGVGKSTYNTQESVFKAKGMSQPFIAPPSNSKAAKPYAKKVQKKFNFNPYGRQSADGFIPNFAPGVDDGQFNNAVKRFSDSVGIFERFGSTLQEAFSGINFSTLSEASDLIFEASKEFGLQSQQLANAMSNFSGGGATNMEIDFSALTDAAGSINQGVSKLSEQLNTPLSIDAGNLQTVVNDMKNINLAVSIPDVNVNVNGADAAANQIKNSVAQEVANKVRQVLTEQSFVTKAQINSWFGTNF